MLGVSARHLPDPPRLTGVAMDLWAALKQLRVESLELTIGAEPDEPAFFSLAAEALREGFDLSFHTPYPEALDLREFGAGVRRSAGADRVKEFYRTWLGGVAALPLGSRKPMLVVHGVNAPGTEPEAASAARATTVAFLRWLARACAEQAARMQLAFELRPRREGWTKVGSSCAEVLTVVEETGLADLGICWDVGHSIVNLLRQDDGWPPPPAFLKRTVHTHLHLATAEEDHFPVTSPAALLSEGLALLAGVAYRGVLNLECHFTCWEEVVTSAELVGRLWEEAQEHG